MSDAELIALAALVNIEAVLMAGDNQVRALRGEFPAWAEGHGMMPAATALSDELARRETKRTSAIEQERDNYKRAVEEAHAALDTCALLTPREISHGGLRQRVEKLVQIVAQKGGAS